MENRFSVRINSLYQAQETLRRSYLRLNRDLEELGAVRYRLAECSNMDECMRRLERIRGDIEGELRALGQMAKSLERAVEYYRAAENVVARQCEEMASVPAKRSWGSNDLSAIHSELARFRLF